MDGSTWSNFSKPERVVTLEAEHVHEGDIVALEDAEEGRHILRPVVDDFDLRFGAAAKEDATHADEWLGVKPVRDRLYPFHEMAGQIALAADISGDGFDGNNR